MKKRLIVVIALLLVAIVAAGIKVYQSRQSASITATGTVEVTLADVVPKINGYLSKLNIEVGDTVKAGQVIAIISRSDLDAQLTADKAALTKAQIQLADLEKGSRNQELEQAAANLSATQAVYNKANADLIRYKALFKDGAIAAQQLDSAQSANDVAYNNLLSAQAQQSLTIEGNRPDVIGAQRAEVARTQALLAVTQANLKDTVIVSPLNGLILTKNYEDGEYVNPGSAIATVGDTNDCWVKVYVASPQLGLLHIGQPLDVHIDTFPDRVFSGTIKEIGQNAEFTPRQSITQQERANMVFYVKVKIDNAQGILKPGMPADVIIR
jgi:HlyD family secretion protein